ncbi:MAG: IclR family transcriptional regulator [Pseudomonadota bacterium]
MKNPESASIQVIDRMAGLLEAIAAAEPASLKVLSAETGLHPSTAHRILASLIDNGLVERNDAGHYRLGARLLGWAGRVQERVDVRREALPIMEALRTELGETVNLTVRDGDEVVYVERVSSHRAVRVEQVIGGRAPLHVTAVGKLFLGFDGQAAALDYAHRTGLPVLTPNTITDPARLWEEARRAWERAYAFDDEEADLGVGCIGVPVRDASGRMVAGLSVSAPIERRRDEWVARVVAAGERLSARLGYRGGQPGRTRA